MWCFIEFAKSRHTSGFATLTAFQILLHNSFERCWRYGGNCSSLAPKFEIIYFLQHLESTSQQAFGTSLVATVGLGIWIICNMCSSMPGRGTPHAFYMRIWVSLKFLHRCMNESWPKKFALKIRLFRLARYLYQTTVWQVRNKMHKNIPSLPGLEIPIFTPTYSL